MFTYQFYALPSLISLMVSVDVKHQCLLTDFTRVSQSGLAVRR